MARQTQTCRSAIVETRDLLELPDGLTSAEHVVATAAAVRRVVSQRNRLAYHLFLANERIARLERDGARGGGED